MKQSNLALRSEPGEAEFPAPAPHAPVAAEDAAPAADVQRLARTRAMGMNYRAIAIGDEGLRPFRVR